MINEYSRRSSRPETGARLSQKREPMRTRALKNDMRPTYTKTDIEVKRHIHTKTNTKRETQSHIYALTEDVSNSFAQTIKNNHLNFALSR